MSTGLLNAVYCNVFGLRTRDEHCSLCVEKYHFGSDDNGDYSVFSGRSSKLYHGGLKHCKLKAQELPKYRIPCKRLAFVWRNTILEVMTMWTTACLVVVLQNYRLKHCKLKAQEPRNMESLNLERETWQAVRQYSGVRCTCDFPTVSCKLTRKNYHPYT